MPGLKFKLNPITERTIPLHILREMDIEDFWKNGNGPDVIITFDENGDTVRIRKHDTNRINILNNLLREKKNGS